MSSVTLTLMAERLRRQRHTAQVNTVYREEKKNVPSNFHVWFCITFVTVRCIFSEHGFLYAYDSFWHFPHGKVVVNPFYLLRIFTFVSDIHFQPSAQTKEVIPESFLNSSNPWLQKLPRGMNNFRKLQQSPGIWVCPEH